MIHDSKSWRIEDPNPNKSLDKIFPISHRAYSLLARNVDHKIMRTNFLSVSGAVDIMFGMEYHHENFMQIVKRFSKGKKEELGNLDHEAVAYVNRIGQFYYFVTSKIVREFFPEAPENIPKIKHLLKFRDKHTAHRSIDKPWNEDTKHLQGVHAMSLTGKSGRIFTPKNKEIGLPQPDPNKRNNWKKLSRMRWKQGYLGYQLNMGKDGVYNLVIERDHPIVMQEAYSIIFEIFE